MPLKYRPYERRTLENLLDTPGLPGEFAYGVLSQTQGGALERMYDQIQRRREQQQQQQMMGQEALSGLGSRLTEAALGGVPAEGLEALVGLQSAANPYLPQQGLDRLMSSATALSGSVGGVTGGLTDEDRAAIIQTAAKEIEAATQEGITDFQTILWRGDGRGLAHKLTVAGYTGEDFEEAKQIIREIWERLGGTFRQPAVVGSPALALPSVPPQTGTGPLDRLGPVLPAETRGAPTGWQDVFGVFPGLFR
jgi:hypothetical protein